ncbi:MAG: family 43 glycosylhydrolase [Verrucomicrobiota bacterium]|jgi:hypothetical protein
MKRATVSAVSLLLAVAGWSINAYGFTNSTILPNENVGDPYIMKFNGVFYLFPSGNRCYSSYDLVNWKNEGSWSADPRMRGTFAPEMFYHNGTFYLVGSPGGNGHYVLTSDAPTGPFVVRTENLGKRFDGDLFFDDDGQEYFFYTGGGDGIAGCGMSNPLSFDGPEVKNLVTLGQWTEGPELIKRNGLYYLTYTGVHLFSPGYRECYAVATSPLGPYQTGGNNPILLNTEGGFHNLGHSRTFIGPDLDMYYTVYHNVVVRANRRMNIDATAFNGSKMVVYGPTNWKQPDPVMPDFYDRFNRDAIGAEWFTVGAGAWGIADRQFLSQSNHSGEFKLVAAHPTGKNFTAEFNMKEVQAGSERARLGVVFNYSDENNYGLVLLNSASNRLEVNFKTNGLWAAQTDHTMLQGWTYGKLHCLRIEKQDDACRFYIDDMQRAAREINGLKAGRIGYVTIDDQAQFGFTAFSSKVNGSSAFDLAKPIPGVIEAVHYKSGGEGVGFHGVSSGASAKTYRSDNTNIRECGEGGYALGGIAAGEWYAYAANIKADAKYHCGIRYSSTANETKLRFLCDDKAISEAVGLPATGGENNYRTWTAQNLPMPEGIHTLKVVTEQGAVNLYTLTFVLAADTRPEASDNFTNAFSAAWNFTDGAWDIQDGHAHVDGWGKRALGNIGWTDYSVSAGIQCPLEGGNAGIMFRLKNPSNGAANDNPKMGTHYFQGYYAGISPTGIVLARINYDWKELARAGPALAAGQSYRLRIDVLGSTYTVYLNDSTTPAITYTDNLPYPFIAGKVGLRNESARGYFDNFKVTALK